MHRHILSGHEFSRRFNLWQEPLSIPRKIKNLPSGFIMHNPKTWIFTALSILGLGCSSPAQSQSPADAATWHDELSFGYMDTDDAKEAAQAFKFAKSSGGFENYYARFNLGNLYFVEGSTPPPKYVQDADGKSGYLGIIMGKNPRLVPLPDKALFAQFMTAFRPDRTKLKGDRLNMILRYLAGTGEILTKKSMDDTNIRERYQIEPQDPSWTEENESLVFNYYTYRSRGNSMMAPYLAKCQLHVDSAQQFTLECNPVKVL